MEFVGSFVEHLNVVSSVWCSAYKLSECRVILKLLAATRSSTIEGISIVWKRPALSQCTAGITYVIKCDFTKCLLYLLRLDSSCSSIGESVRSIRGSNEICGISAFSWGDKIWWGLRGTKCPISPLIRLRVQVLLRLVKAYTYFGGRRMYW